MGRDLNRFLCKFGPYLVIGLLILLVAVVQVHEYKSADELEQMTDLHLPRAKVDLSSANTLNNYHPRAIMNSNAGAGASSSVVFIVRTYAKHAEDGSMLRLLDSLDKQECPSGHEGCHLHLSVVLLPTDRDSKKVVEDKWTSLLASGKYKRIELLVHRSPDEIYNDNCCQIDAMCGDEKWADLWKQHSYRRYGRYKNVPKKVASICAGNNLLHYVLTDLALRYTMNSCGENCDRKLVVMTNGDNEYHPHFVFKAATRMKENPSFDLVMTDYLERGVQLVEPTIRINQMDLGCMVFRISSLLRLFPVGLPILSSLPSPNTWPDHYYGADGEFVTNLHRQGATVGYQRGEALFTHW